jgi:predicted DNA-binding protein (MmcQ/YjbR family)
MHIDQLRKFCLSFPGATEQIQWGDHLLFKIGGKMFAITSLEPSPVWLTLKANPETFAELTERPGIIPAPYLARAKWIGLESREALSIPELEHLLRKSYDMVLDKLPEKTRRALAAGKSGSRVKSQKRKKRPRSSKRVTRRKDR